MYREWDHLLGFGLFGCTFLRFLMIVATHNGSRDFLTTTFYFKGDLVLGLLLSGLLYLHIDVVLCLGRRMWLNIEVHHMLRLWLVALFHLNIDFMLCLGRRMWFNIEVHDLLGPISFWNFHIDNLFFGIMRI